MSHDGETRARGERVDLCDGPEQRVALGVGAVLHLAVVRDVARRADGDVEL